MQDRGMGGSWGDAIRIGAWGMHWRHGGCTPHPPVATPCSDLHYTFGESTFSAIICVKTISE
jgi:hypothetical protein